MGKIHLQIWMKKHYRRYCDPFSFLYALQLGESIKQDVLERLIRLWLDKNPDLEEISPLGIYLLFRDGLKERGYNYRYKDFKAIFEKLAREGLLIKLPDGRYKRKKR